jgi:hypothetical protein
VRDAKTATTTATTMTTTTNNKSIGSHYLTNYIRNVQQASKGTAAQYEYRLLKFEKYVMAMPSKEEQQQELQQQQNQELIITLDNVINELKNNGNNNNNNNKIDPYELLSGFVAYLEEEENIENPNTIRYFIAIRVFDIYALYLKNEIDHSRYIDSFDKNKRTFFYQTMTNLSKDK